MAARFGLGRIVEGFRRAGGDEVATTAGTRPRACQHDLLCAGRGQIYPHVLAREMRELPDVRAGAAS